MNTITKGVLATAICCTAVGIGANHADALQQTYYTTNNLNVRSGPSTSYSKLTLLPSGTKVTVISSNNGWSKIKYSSNKTGYVAQQYLTNKNPNKINNNSTVNKNDSSYKTYYTTSNLNMRKGPSTSYNKITTIPSGSKVLVITSGNGWSEVVYNNKTGYVSNQYLSSRSTNSNNNNSSSSKAYYTTGNLNLRKGPSTSYSRIATIPSGTKLNVTSTSNGWSKVTYNGKTGYVDNRYLTSKTTNMNSDSNSTNKQVLNRLVIVNKDSKKLAYYENGKLVNSFYCTIGKKSTQTPSGRFKIQNKLVNPYYPDKQIAGGAPNNPLGKRWMGLITDKGVKTSYGIHGTYRTDQIGTEASNGCVRLTNPNVIWLFEYLHTGDIVIIGNGYNKDIASKYGYKIN